MEIKLWQNFSKRVNSTKQPGAASATLSATLKAPTSIENPTFTVSGNVTSYNYAQAFGHYYFIEDIIQNTNGTSDLVCVQDVLATYKSYIQNYEGLICYSGTSQQVFITDPRNHPTTKVKTITQTLRSGSGASFFGNTFTSSSGSYHLIVQNTISSAAGVACAYELNSTGVANLAAELCTGNVITKAQQEFNGVQNAILDFKWVPTSKFGSENSDYIKIGSQTMTAATGNIISTRYWNYGPISYSIDQFPGDSYTGIQGSYLDKPPYCTGVLYLPFVGCVPLDLDAMQNDRTVKIEAIIDAVSCDIAYKVYQGNTAGTVSTYSGNIATNYPLSATTRDALGLIGGSLSAIGGIGMAIAGVATENPALIGSGVSSAMGGTISNIRSAQIHTSTCGGISSGLGYKMGYEPMVCLIMNEPSETDLLAFKDELGMPLFIVGKIGDYPGYCQMQNASVEIPGLASDRDEVNRYLNTGFYYE